MALTSNIYYNKQRIKENGTATVYIRVLANREKELINMHFEWPVHLIDTEGNMLLPRWKGDPEQSDLQIILISELAKINEIARMARLRDREISIKEFRAEYKNFDNKGDFTDYFAKKIKYRTEKLIIRPGTAATQASALATFRKFRKTVLFNEISRQLLDDYKAYMFNALGLDSDTALTKLTILRTYMNQARQDGHIFDYPFLKFKMPSRQSRIEYLDETEFKKLKDYFYSGLLTPGINKEKALRCYLFICYTGVRIGDFQTLTHSHVRKNILSFKPGKNTDDLQKIVEIPLHAEALRLITTKKGKLFEFPSSEEKMREMLAEIAQHLDIQGTCSPHTGRHTFATRFLRAGGRIEVLKELLGHESIKSTMIYVHVDMARKKAEMDMMD